MSRASLIEMLVRRLGGGAASAERPSIRQASTSLREAIAQRMDSQADLFPQSAPGPLPVYHGTPRNFDPNDIEPWSHFGTEGAARDRLKALGGEGRLLPYEITGRRIDVGEEYPSLIGGATHGDVTPGDVADLLLRGRHISPEDHAWATEPLLTGSRFQGRDAADVVKERLGEIAARNDIGAIGYRNTVEDAGSRSYIVPNPRLNVRPT